jgi:hypothetical protein
VRSLKEGRIKLGHRHEGTKKRNMKFKLLRKRGESIAEKIVDAAITVRKVLGSGKCFGFCINFNAPLIKSGISRNLL